MALAIDGQVEVNGLLMGPDTPFYVAEFNPYTRTARNRQADRVWGPGAWSGREDIDATAIPMRIHLLADDVTGWVAAQQALHAALRASSVDVELKWRLGGVDYLMFVRPRLVEPSPAYAEMGHGPARVALMALDPRIYGATLNQVTLGLPSTTGGLTIPFTIPFTVSAVTTAGRVSITNAGTEETPMSLLIEANGAQLVQPRITLVSGSTISVLRVNLTLEAGQYLEIDTGNRTVYLNGTSSRRGYVSGDFPLLPAGTSDLAFDAGTYSSVAELTASWRDTW
jgi:hypothetical protein